MNKRIKDLCDRCWEEDGVGEADFNPEKFSELIIEDIIKLLEGVPFQYQDYRSQIEESMKNYCIWRIKNYFKDGQ